MIINLGISWEKVKITFKLGEKKISYLNVNYLFYSNLIYLQGDSHPYIILTSISEFGISRQLIRTGVRYFVPLKKIGSMMKKKK